MSNRGRGGGYQIQISDKEIVDTMCDSALADIRKENRDLKQKVEELLDQVRDMKKSVKDKNQQIKKLTQLQVVKDQAIDKLNDLCESNNNQIQSLQTEVAILVDELDNILSGFIERARKRQKSQRTTSESGETTK